MRAEAEQYCYNILKHWMILNVDILISNVLMGISVTACRCVIRYEIIFSYLSKTIFDNVGSKHGTNSYTVEFSRNFQEFMQQILPYNP